MSSLSISKEEATAITNNAKPEQLIREKTIDSTFAVIRQAARKGLYQVSVAYLSEELPYVSDAIQALKNQGFAINNFKEEPTKTTVQVSWE